MTRPTFEGVRLPRGQDSEGTTQLMNLRSENLFEIFNAAEIYDEPSLEAGGFATVQADEIPVRSLVIDGFCYVCADSTVVIFRVDSKAEHESSFSLGAPIFDMCQVPGQNVILFLLRNGTIRFYVCEKSKLSVATEQSLFQTTPSTARVAFGGCGKSLSACVLASHADGRCEAHFLKLPRMSVMERSSTEFVDGMAVAKRVDNLPRCYLGADEEAFVFFPHKKDTPIRKQTAFALHQPRLVHEPLATSLTLPCGVRGVFRMGRLTAVLLESFECLLYNEFQSMMPAGKLQFDTFKGDILDLVVLDCQDSVLSANLRMVVHVNDGQRDKVVLTNVHGSKVDFEFETSARVCLNASTAQTDLNNNVVVIEAFTRKRPTSVNLRFVYEAQPEIRLRNLLEKGRFEEALACAKVYSLPLDKVYERQIAFLIQGGNHWDIFVEMLEQQKIDKCRRLFADFRASMAEQWVQNSHDFLGVLLLNLQKTIIVSEGAACTIVADFLEHDLLPPFFTDENIGHLLPFQPQLVEFFKKIALSLWNIDQANYPKNALYFSSTFSRVINTQLARDGDSSEKHWIANCLMELGVGITTFDTPCTDLARMVTKMKQLGHLKEKYHFEASYETFQYKTVDDVGFHLLDKMHSIRNSISYMRETVFAFCKEFNLDRDTLLLAYIQRADLSKIVQMCIEMCKEFRNPDYCAKAAMIIAPSCALPWSPEITDLFARLLNRKDLPQLTHQKLRETVLRAKISVILHKYGAQVMLRMENKRDLIDYCSAMFAPNQVPIAQRVADAQEICRLSLQNPRIHLTPTECFSTVIRNSYARANNMLDMQQPLSILSHLDDRDVLRDVAQSVASYAYLLLCLDQVLDSHIPLAANLLERVADFLPTDEGKHYKERAYSVKQLYLLYGIVVPADRLGVPDECTRIFRAVMDANQERPLNELLRIGSLLLMPKETIVRQRIEYLVEGEFEDLIKETLKQLPRLFNAVNEEVIEAIHTAISFVFLRLAQFTYGAMEINRLVELTANVKAVTSMIIARAKTSRFDLEFCAIMEFCRFLEKIALACQTEREEPTEEDRAFLLMEDRLKITLYDQANEPPMFNVNAIVQAVCRVAPSACFPTKLAELSPEHLRDEWMALFRLLYEQNQDWLLACAFQLCARYAFFDGHIDEFAAVYDESLVRLLERMLATLNCAWHTVFQLVGCRGPQRAVIARAVRSSRLMNTNRTLLVNAYILKFIFGGIDAQSVAHFQKFGWQVELANHGVRVSSKFIDQPEQAIPAFVEALLSPTVVSSLCRSYGIDLNSTLIRYAMACCLRHSAMASKSQSEILRTASECLEFVKRPTEENIRAVLHDVELQFCPYDYAAIRLALDWCERHVRDGELATYIQQMQKFLQFLSEESRRNVATQAELAWYRRRYERAPAFLNETATSADERQMDATNQPAGGGEKPEIIRNPFGAIRLPFQAFLPLAGEDVRAVSTAVCEDQITTESLHRWTIKALELPRILARGRHYFEASSVQLDLRRRLECREPCDEDLMLRSSSVIQYSHQMLPHVLKTVFVGLGDVVLSEHKVAVFDHLIRLLERSLTAAGDGRPDDEKTEDLRALLKEVQAARNVLFVSNLLTDFHLLNAETEALAHDAPALCRHIFAEATNWEDEDEIKRHYRFVGVLERQKLVSFAAIADELIFGWLKTNLQQADVSALSMDLSMETDDGQPPEASDLAVPYFSADVTRMAFLLGRRCDEALAEKIKTLKFLDVKEGVEKKLRMLCVIYRALGKERCEQMFQISEQALLTSF
ncbi:Kinetochore-associated protein 1-like protein [Aphelenchoides fujianensis]|nr:Kinetochore-associated protein 1-like protein [Aphelenchoides fujianensis]